MHRPPSTTKADDKKIEGKRIRRRPEHWPCALGPRSFLWRSSEVRSVKAKLQPLRLAFGGFAACSILRFSGKTMTATLLTRWLTSNQHRAKNTRLLNPSRRRVRLLLEILEGRDLPALLTIAPTVLEASVGAPIGLHALTASGGEGVLTTYLDASAGLAFPEGLAFDSSGNLYATNFGSSTVSEVTPGGTVSTFVPSSAGLFDPEGLAFDSSGNLYVANAGSNTISEVTPNGLVSTFVSASAGLSGPIIWRSIAAAIFT